MLDFFQQVLTILTTTPGSLAYHLVMAFSIAWALQGALVFWRTGQNIAGRRMVLGLSFLLLLRLALFTVAASTWQGFLPASIMAPADRGISLLSLLVVTWLWVFPKPVRLADAGNVLLSLLVIFFIAFSLLWWTQNGAGIAFNGSWPDLTSNIFALLLIGLSGLMLLARRPAGWAMGFSMLGLLFAGYLAHTVYPLPGSDLALAVRLAEMAAFPMLLVLPQRFPTPTQALPPADLETARRAAHSDSEIIQAALGLLNETDLSRVCPAITRLIAEKMVADLCLLVAIGKNQDNLTVECGYNLIRQEQLGGLNLAGRLAPTLANSFRRRRPLRLPANSTSIDLGGLSEAMGSEQVGHLLAVPVPQGDDGKVFGFVLLSPYSNRGWTVEDQEYLVEIAALLGGVWKHTQHSEALQVSLETTRQETVALQTQAQQIQAENEELLSQLEAARQYAAQEHSRAESLAALVASQETTQETIARLETEARRLQEELETNRLPETPDVEHLEAELRLALEEVAHLKTVLSETDKKILELEGRSGGAPISDEQLSVVASISHELRQPMSSIVGYTDLLLGESVGVLGALQRKFLERIKASVERMGALIDDLIQLTVIENGKFELSPEAVDINLMIDDAIAVAMPQMREKNILLRVDLAENLPQVKADRDAIQQILIHLLQNAGTASPNEGEISLHARVREDEDNKDFVLLQVSDSGGGIAPEDLPRVFSRLYRASNTPITGLGENGIGLSMVKTLVEGHGGRVWVDTEVSKGSTFSVLLPVSYNLVSPSPVGGKAA